MQHHHTFSLRSLVGIAMLGTALVMLSGFQMQSGKDHISLQPIKASGRAGDTLTVTGTLKIDKFWHTYGTREVVNSEGLGPLPTTFSMEHKQVKMLGMPRFTKGLHTHYDSVWATKVDEVSGKAEYQFKIVLHPVLQKGAVVQTRLSVDLQMCDTVSCLPPETIDVPLEVTVTENAAVLPADSAGAPEFGDTAGAIAQPATDTGRAGSTDGVSVNEEIEQQKSGGLLNFFFYAMGVGFLALFTPCVFPMIPITVSFFTKRHEKSKGSSKGFSDSIVFGLGIISTFTAVGIITSIIFGGAAIQNMAASPLLNIAFGALFLALAFNLFGAYEIQVPVGIMNKLNKKATGNSTASVWVMGFVFSLTSFTCTVPFIGTLLLSAANADSADAYIYPAVGTLGFATAFAIPFAILSLFPALLVRLPRAGGWMNNLKVIMGFLEIAAAVKFFSNADLAAAWGVIPREVFLSIWAGVGLLTTLYILGVFEMKLDTKVEKVGAWRATLATVFASLTFWFAAGMMGSELGSFVEALLPPENYKELMDKANGVASAGIVPELKDEKNGREEGHTWIDNLDSARVRARRENKPIFIDFTGFTCTNCRLMEKYVFSKAVVSDRFEKFILVQLYTDRREEPYISNQKILAGYGTIANPLYVLLKPDGSFIAKSGYLPKYQADPATFAEFLDQALGGAQASL
ncbi:MAG: cytochrome c biogenesis protein CcdA [Candidatus Kapaibacterium sp.]|nr:MAG: cytochrome c biogenesis protein CcdA [Candidatus Kapabacteria bacterium]